LCVGVSPNSKPSRARIESFGSLGLWTGPCKLLYRATKGSFEITSACARESPSDSGGQPSLQQCSSAAKLGSPRCHRLPLFLSCVRVWG
ncbi:unnamed protein product, partial [Ectocarpus sp. 12 AP-2014]